MRERILRVLVRALVPYCKLESATYIKSLKDSISSKQELIEKQSQYIQKLEELVESKYHIPKNFDSAVKQINDLTSKARATFLFRLIDKADEDTLDTISKYLHLKNKQDNM
jgi:hypothetical protein